MTENDDEQSRHDSRPERCPVCGCVIGDMQVQALAAVYCEACRERSGITNISVADLNAADGEGSEI